MEKKKWAIICLTALLLSGLLIGCGTRKDSEETQSPTPIESTALDESDASAESSGAVDSPESIESPESTESPEPTQSDSARNPNLDWELIDFPDLDGFEKLVVEEAAMVVYSNGMVSMAIQYLEATQEQLDELAQGGGTSLEPIFAQLVGEGTASAGKLIDLPGLDRKGLELNVTVDDDNEYIGLIVPSNGQVLTLFGMSLPADKQVLMDGYDQLVKKLTV